MNANATAAFVATVPDYNGRGATSMVVFGSILAENTPEASVIRDLTRGEARAALCRRFPSLAGVEGITIAKVSGMPSAWCDVVPSYAIPR